MKRSNIQDQVKASSYLFCWDFDNTIVKGYNIVQVPLDGSDEYFEALPIIHDTSAMSKNWYYIPEYARGDYGFVA